jgi:hypothetical protein
MNGLNPEEIKKTEILGALLDLPTNQHTIQTNPALFFSKRAGLVVI